MCIIFCFPYSTWYFWDLQILKTYFWKTDLSFHYCTGHYKYCCLSLTGTLGSLHSFLMNEFVMGKYLWDYSFVVVLINFSWEWSGYRDICVCSVGTAKNIFSVSNLQQCVKFLSVWLTSLGMIISVIHVSADGLIFVLLWLGNSLVHDCAASLSIPFVDGHLAPSISWLLWNQCCSEH